LIVLAPTTTDVVVVEGLLGQLAGTINDRIDNLEIVPTPTPEPTATLEPTATEEN
jgi:hypothetical protein